MPRCGWQQNPSGSPRSKRASCPIRTNRWYLDISVMCSRRASWSMKATCKKCILQIPTSPWCSTTSMSSSRLGTALNLPRACASANEPPASCASTSPKATPSTASASRPTPGNWRPRWRWCARRRRARNYGRIQVAGWWILFPAMPRLFCCCNATTKACSVSHGRRRAESCPRSMRHAPHWQC